MKMLIAGPNFHGYNNSIVRAFREFNCNVEISEWPDLSGDLFYQTKLLVFQKINKISSDRELQRFILKEMKNMIIDYNKKLFYQIKETNPDILLVLKGDIVLPKTIEKIKEKTKTICVMWCYDKATRYPNVVKGGKQYHIFYVYEPTDIQKLKRYNIHANFLPMAYDPKSYFKLEDETATRDISFVGVLNDQYPERKKILELIISQHKNLKLEIWGGAWTWYNPFLQYEYKIKRRALGKHVHNYNIPPEEVNKVYNTTKICLNIHHWQSKEGVNPRTFEILGAGGFQLIDYKKVLEELFDIGREIVCYKNEADLLEKIDYYLENEDERKKIARRGNDIVKKKHTYKHRAETILSDIETLR